MLEFKYVLLIFVFVLSFVLPCGKLFCWEPLRALIYAKQILADAKANAAARKKAEAAKGEAKRARDEELAESHRIKRLLREQARAKKAALEAAAAAGAKARKHRTPGGMLKTEWDPHGLKGKQVCMPATYWKMPEEHSAFLGVVGKFATWKSPVPKDNGEEKEGYEIKFADGTEKLPLEDFLPYLV